MDLFNGNKQLEEAVFTGMNHALWSRARFAPGSIEKDDFSQFIFPQLNQQLKKRPEVLAWEKQFGRNITLSFFFGHERMIDQ